MLQVSQERVQVSLDVSHLFGPWMKITSRHGAKPGWPKNQFKVDRRSCASSWRCLLEAVAFLVSVPCKKQSTHRFHWPTRSA